MNQSEFEANTRNRRQARENACEQNTIGFGLDSHLVGKMGKWENGWENNTSTLNYSRLWSY